MRRSLYVSLLGIVVLAVLALAGTIAAGNTPQLGLDLQGGASVVLQPAKSVDSDVLDEAINIIRKRVDGIGVAEPEITRQGDAIVVELPGVKDQERALALVGKTAELIFRPVIGVYPGKSSLTTSTTTGATTTTTPGATTTTTSGATTTTTSGATTTPVSATTVAAGGPGKSYQLPAQTATTTATTAAATTAASTAETAAPSSETTTATTTAGATTEVPAVDADGLVPLTPTDQDLPANQVVLPQVDRDGNEVARYVMGASPLTGRAIKSAKAQFVNEWEVSIEFHSGQQGLDGFNALSTECFNTSSTCPAGLTAIVLDGVVLSAPRPNSATFENGVSITGNFTQREAQDLALGLRYGSLPIELTPQQVQTVSATLGKDSLRAGIVSGLVGLALVLVFMTFYYRTLGALVMALGLCLSGALMWSIISYLGVHNGLALTLSGATGIIVSIGVTIDSYVVYFERLKDDVRLGRSVRSSAERGFKGAYRTIIAADLVSLLASVVLWYLTVGSVRGFAFFLGLSTVLDMVVAYFFTRPLVIWLSRSGRFMRASAFGVPLLAAAGPRSSVASAPVVGSPVPPRPTGGTL